MRSPAILLLALVAGCAAGPRIPRLEEPPSLYGPYRYGLSRAPFYDPYFHGDPYFAGGYGPYDGPRYYYVERPPREDDDALSLLGVEDTLRQRSREERRRESEPALRAGLGLGGRSGPLEGLGRTLGLGSGRGGLLRR